MPFKCNVHRYTPVLDPYVPGGAIANACVVVTGANRGIGLEFARQLLAKSPRNSVVATCRDAEGASDLLDPQVVGLPRVRVFT